MFRKRFVPCVISAGFTLGLLLASGAMTKEPPKSDSALDGVWKLVTWEADGKAVPDARLKDGKLVLDGDAYTVTLADMGTVQGTQKLDPTKEPKTIDIKDATGSNKGQTCLGIYEIEGDTLRVAFAPAGKPRPTKFTTEADSGQWLHVWKRVKE